MAYAKHKLGKTFYIAKGSGKTPLICLHGGPGSAHGANTTFFEFSNDRKVVVYDQLGCGQSSKTPKSKWKMSVFADELELLAKSLKLEKFFIFGVSCGATLALEYYLKYPDRVKGIIFQSPFFSTKDWQKDAIALIKKMDKKNKDILLKTIKGIPVTEEEYAKAKRAYYLRHVIRNKKIYDGPSRYKKNKSGEQIYNYMWGKSEHHVTGTLITYEQGKALKNVKVPSIVICGEHDEATPKSGRKYAKTLPHGAFKEVKGASHAITREKPKALKKLVKKFIEENE